MNIIDRITTKIECYVHAFNINHDRLQRIKAFDDSFSKTIILNNVPNLTESVASEIKAFWSKYLKYDIGLNFQRIAALKIPAESLPYIVSDSVLYPIITKILNPENQARVLEDKGLSNVLFNDVKHPLEIVRNVKGIFTDSNFELIDRNAAFAKILSYKQPVVFKKSVNSFGGYGVRVFKEYDEPLIRQQFNYFKTNFVVQEYLSQSEQTARFNPSSLNTFRITTLLLNGRLSILGAWLKCGGKGANVDNLTSGGMGACVLPDGRLTYAINLNKLKIDFSPTGLRFEDCRIEHFDRIIEKAKQFHKRIPMISMVGWDFALDVNDEPVFIEANLRNPDTFPWQTTQGPIFGDRLQEVLDYCFSTGKNN
jgi:hypothetical protein